MASPSVLHVIDSLRVGGAERMAVEIANGTAEAGGNVGICMSRVMDQCPVPLHPEVELFQMGRVRTIDWGAMARFRSWLGSRDYRVIHGHDPTTFALLGFMKALGWMSLPVVFHDHRGAAMASSPPPWIRWGGHRLAGRYVAVCEDQRAWAQAAGFSDHDIQVIPNALALDRISIQAPVDVRREFDISRAGLVGVVVANLRAEKGIDHLLQALSRGMDGVAAVVVVGADHDRDHGAMCRRLAQELGLKNRVRFVGGREDSVGLLQGADFALMPSRSESGPLALIEALICGRPVVAFDVGDVAHRAQHAGIQGIIAAGAVEDFAREMRSLVGASAAEREARGLQGRAWAMREFDIGRVVPAWLSLYEELAD